MTDLDRLLELKDKILVEKFKHIKNENIDSTQLEQEYQSLYEKLKSDHEIVERLKELIESAKEYPYDQIEMKIVIENLKSILENKK